MPDLPFSLYSSTLVVLLQHFACIFADVISPETHLARLVKLQTCADILDASAFLDIAKMDNRISLYYGALNSRNTKMACICKHFLVAWGLKVPFLPCHQDEL